MTGNSRKYILHRGMVLVVLLWTVTGCCFGASEPEYELIPLRDGKDLSRGNKKVLVSTPKDWKSRKVRDYSVGFHPVGRSGGPVMIVEANHIGRHYLAEITARNSYMGANLESESVSVKNMEAFDAGANGSLRIWRVRTPIRDYLLTIITQPDNEGRTEVDIFLEDEGAEGQLMSYLQNLKELARSIRVVNDK